jgi:hypothetical protein
MNMNMNIFATICRKELNFSFFIPDILFDQIPLKYSVFRVSHSRMEIME